MRNYFTTLLLSLTSIFCSPVTASTDTVLIRQHLTALTHTPQPRSYENISQLDSTAAFIKSVFELYSDSVTVQSYKLKLGSGTDSALLAVSGKKYHNIICSFGTENKRRIIVGAHYDVCEHQQGADDNATGVTGLLELARMLKGQKLNYRIDLVAYTLEEPPFFGTPVMGSCIHAYSLQQNRIDVYGMVALEMIGYFKDEKGSQKYPIPLLKMFYGNKGNYITLVRKYNSGKFARQFCKQYKSANTIRTKKFTGPASLPGIDLSDHLNYWDAGYSALMITDTAFYRNPNYHKSTDKMETLDLYRMAKVIDGVYHALLTL